MGIFKAPKSTAQWNTTRNGVKWTQSDNLKNDPAYDVTLDANGHVIDAQPKEGWLPGHAGPLILAGMAISGAAGAMGGAGGAAGPSITVNGTTVPFAAGGNVAGAGSGGGLWGTLINAGSNLFGNMFGAHEQTSAADRAAQIAADAARYTADQQTAAAARAEAFDRQQAENTYLGGEADRKGNYDQWAAAQALHNRVRDALGYGSQDIPAYVGGVDPRFTDPSAPAPVPGGPVVPTANTGVAGNPAAVAASRGLSAPGSVGAYVDPTLAPGPRVANAPIQFYDPRRVAPGSVGSYLR